MRNDLKSAACASALLINAALQLTPALARTNFYPGWEKDTAKTIAFDGCMFDYGFGMQESAVEKNRHWKSLGSRVTSEMMEEFSSIKGWEDKYNDAIKDMTAVCHEAARRIQPGIFRIDYTKGGKRGWKNQAVVDIAYRNCLESDPMMTKERIDSLQFGAGANPYDMKNIELREKRTKGTLLAMDIPGSIKELGAGSDKCKKLLAGLSHNRKQISQQSKQVISSSKQSAHKECLEAKDYEGCMKFQISSNKADGTEDECTGKICLINTKGADVYGLPKPVGWFSLQADDGRLFYYSRTYRVPHNGQEARYVAIRRITRVYNSPEPGYSGTIIGSNRSTTNCTSYGGSINCTTSGTMPTYIEGKSGTSGGVSSTSFDEVYDCKDNTNAAYKADRMWIGWKPGSDFFAEYLKKTCEKGEDYIRLLPILRVRM